MEVRIGVRQLRARLSDYLRRVKGGQTIVITERGQDVGRIIPSGRLLPERLEALRRGGVIAWSGKKARRGAPPARARGPRTVADLLLEDRG
jgi:prevent-host-death family protein